MELSLFTPFLLFLIPFLFYRRNKSVRLPPGTSGLPFIGETLSLFIKMRRGVQFEFVSDRMSKYSSNIFRTSLMGEQVVILSGAEGNKFLFSNEGKLVQSWFPTRVEKIFPRSDGQPNNVHATRIRKLIVPWILKINGLQDCVGFMNTVMKQHLKAYWTCKNEQAEMIIKGADMAKRYALALGCSIFLGINDLSGIECFVKGMDDIESAFLALPVSLPGTSWNRGLKASSLLRSKVEALVREKKMQMLKQSTNSVDKDFIAEMISARDENGELTPIEDMASNLVGLLEAGYMTLQTTITMLLKTLAEHPHVYDSVLKEQMAISSSTQPGERLKWEDFEKMKYSRNVMSEVLRLYSPGAGFKEALVDFKYEGYTIPKGWKIYWLPQSIHMNPIYFRDPEKFDLSRFDGEGPISYTFVPFGKGLRMCPGYKFAELATLTFLHYVVTKFRWEKVNPNEKMVYGIVPSSAEGLAIRLHRHKFEIN